MLRYLLALLCFSLIVFTCGKTTNQQGQALYQQHCANCHMEAGEGLGKLIPPLTASDYLRDYPKEVVRGIRYGMQGPLQVNGVTYDEVMPTNADLSEFQIVNIVNYINQAWGNDYPPITVAQTREWLANPPR